MPPRGPTAEDFKLREVRTQFGRLRGSEPARLGRGRSRLGANSRIVAGAQAGLEQALRAKPFGGIGRSSSSISSGVATARYPFSKTRAKKSWAS